ncbi:MAG TPA: hypothetical protein VMF09_03710 [Solirubrobacteraceae bacterium]|nr:hypothetical protein [Solirubrobacteraceae bacterium]
MPGRFDTARRRITRELAAVKKLAPCDELVERRERLTRALAALDGARRHKEAGSLGADRRIRRQHPGAMPAEIAAALEIPAANAHAHLGRNEGSVFERRVDGWHVIEGWEKLRRGEDDG